MLDLSADGHVCLVVSHLASLPTRSVAGCCCTLKRPILTPGESHRPGDLTGHRSVTPVPGVIVWLVDQSHVHSLAVQIQEVKLFPIGRLGCFTWPFGCGEAGLGGNGMGWDVMVHERLPHHGEESAATVWPNAMSAETIALQERLSTCHRSSSESFSVSERADNRRLRCTGSIPECSCRWRAGRGPLE